MRIDGRVLERVSAGTRFADIRLLDEVDSTNRVAREAAAAGAPEGLVVVADAQTAGRGRHGRSWDAPAGTGLLVSVLLRPGDLGPAELHLATAAVGLSARDAVRAAGADAELKWPNDLLSGGRKLAGVLAEAVEVGSGERAGRAAVVVGVGLNVSAAPEGAVCVEQLTGRPADVGGLLADLLAGVEARCGRWGAVAAEYAAACSTVGRRVAVEAPPGRWRSGVAVRLAGDGALVVAFDADADADADGDADADADGDTGGRRPGAGGEEVVHAGDVVHLRDEPPGVGC